MDYKPGWDYRWTITAEQAKRILHWGVKGDGADELRLLRKADSTFWLEMGTVTLGQIQRSHAEALLLELRTD